MYTVSNEQFNRVRGHEDPMSSIFLDDDNTNVRYIFEIILSVFGKEFGKSGFV